MPNTLSSCRSRRDASEKPTNPPPVTSTIMIHSDDCRRADLDIFSTLNPLVLSEEYGAVITLEPSGVSKKKFLRITSPIGAARRGPCREGATRWRKRPRRSLHHIGAMLPCPFET